MTAPFHCEPSPLPPCRLVELARQGEYDERLALGLSTLEIELPPLAKRMQDLPLLTQAFIEQINAENEKQVGGATGETLDLLAGYTWPENLDELAAVVAPAHAQAKARRFAPATFREDTPRPGSGRPATPEGDNDSTGRVSGEN